MELSRTDYSSENLILWRGRYEHDPDTIDNVVSKIIDMPETKRECGNGVLHSTFFIDDIFKRPEVELLDSYKEIVGQICLDLNIISCQTSFAYWSQVYDGEHTEHLHASADVLVSFVHFVRPTDKKCFYFSQSDGQRFYPKQEPGDIIVFPSWALHGIEESYGNIRMTIAGNILFSTISTPNNDFFSTIKKVREGLYITENFT
jgi:hypothetical protein